MKRHLLFIAFFGLLCLHAQMSNFIIFSEDGFPFQLVLNGVVQNADFATNVKVEGLNAENYTMRIIFQSKAEPAFSQNNLYLPLGMETTYKVKKNSKGKMVLRSVSSVPVPQMPVAPVENQVVMPYQPVAPAPSLPNAPLPSGTNINVNINLGGNNTPPPPAPGSVPPPRPMPAPAPAPAPAPVVYVPGYNGPIGCPMPMDPMSFENAKNTIASKSFDDSKLMIAKQVLNSNCMTTAQVGQLASLFTFEDRKLEFAKFCYGRTYDPANYYTLNNLFTFESSIQELDAYIKSQPAPVVILPAPAPAPAQPVYFPSPAPAPVVYVPGYNGPIGCPMPMDPMSFENAKNTIASKSFDDSKLMIAKQVLNSNCLTTAQVGQLASLFTFEDRKLEFAKFCYGRTYDPANYYTLNNLFTFESSIEELDAYIRSH